MADPDIRKRQDDDEEEVPSRLRPIGAAADAESSARLQPASASANSARLQPIQSTAVQQPDQSLLEAPRRSLMTFRSREEARRHGEDLNAPAGGPQLIPEPGSSGAARVQLEQLADEKANPYGSPENHPGRLGRLAHIASRIGNVAGDVLIPRQMEMIPGTDLNRAARTAEATEQLGQAETRENAESREAETERHNLAEENISGKKATAAAQKEADQLAEHGLARDEQGNIAPLPPEKLSATARQKMQDEQTLGAYRKAQTDLAEASEEVKRAQNDPNSPQFKMAMKKLQMADLAHQIAAQNLGLHQEQFANKLQEQELVKPSGQAQSRGSAAQAVLDLIPDLKTLVNKHREDMGPIMGRINRGEIAIGNVDPEIAKVYSAMKSFYALQPAVHGFRNAEFVKDFEHALGTLERNPDAFIAGMEGLKPTLESVAKEGKTFHKRIVEGAGGGGAFKVPEGAPSAKGVPDGKVLKDSTGKVIARAKGEQWQAP